MGGFAGAVYSCPNCYYIGPVVIETEEGLETRAEEPEFSTRLSHVDNTRNRIGLFSGLGFMAIGIVVGFSPLPLIGGRLFGAFGLTLFAVGGMLVFASGLFWLAERYRREKTVDKGSQANTDKEASL